MARKEEDYFNKVVLVMLITVVVLGLLSLSLYLSGNSDETSNEEPTPQLKAQGKVSLTIEKQDSANEKEKEFQQ